MTNYTPETSALCTLCQEPAEWEGRLSDRLEDTIWSCCGTQFFALPREPEVTETSGKPRKNRRPLKWTHNEPEGWHVYTFTADCYCECSIDATRFGPNHWVMSNSAGFHETFESYTGMQNEAAQMIDDDSFHQFGWTLPDGRVMQERCHRAKDDDGSDDYLADTLGDDDEAKAAAIAYCQDAGIDISEPYMNADGKVVPPVIKGWSRIRTDNFHTLEVSHIRANIGTRKGEYLACAISVITADGEEKVELVSGGWIEPKDWLYQQLPAGSCDDTTKLEGWLDCYIPQGWGITPAESRCVADTQYASAHHLAELGLLRDLDVPDFDENGTYIGPCWRAPSGKATQTATS